MKSELSVTQLVLRVLGMMVIAVSLAFTGCDRKGPAEEAGEAIDDAVEDVGEALGVD
jgi:hypothetical protein